MRALQTQPTRTVPAQDGKAVPVRSDGARGTPLGEVERLVLSRVDGCRNISDISALLGFATSEGVMVVARLAELGAITLSSAVDVELDDGWDKPSSAMPTVRPLPEQEPDE